MGSGSLASNRARHLMGAALLVAAGSAAAQDSSTAPGDRLGADWSAFADIVLANYWRPVDLQALHRTCEAAAELAMAMVSSTQMSHEACVSAALRVLDERSRYVTAKESAAMDKEPRRWVGIGLELSRPNTPGPIRIVQPIHGGPGARAGLLPGDDVYAIDGVDVTPLTMREAIPLFRGEPGTLVMRRGSGAGPELMSGRSVLVRPT